MAVDVAQQTAVTAAAFRHQNTSREDAGRVELNGFHVAEAGNAAFQGQSVTGAFANLSVGRHAEELAGTARSDSRSLGNVSVEFARDQITNHSAVAALAVMNQRKSFNTFNDRHLFGDHAVGNSVEHGVASAVRHEAGTPLLGTTEVTLTDQTSSFLTFGNGDLFTIDNHLAIARGDTAPGHTPCSQFTHSLRRGVHEHANHVLVSTPVRATNGIGEVDVFVVANTLNDVSQGCLHAALRRLGVRTLRRHQRQNDGIMTAALGSYCHTQTGQTATDHQYVGVNNLHFKVSLIR